MIDMYHPGLDRHYLAQPSQVRVLRKSGWLPYDEWLAANPPAEEPIAEPTPEPAPEPTPTETTTPEVTETTEP